MNQRSSIAARTPLLEWVAAGIGLVCLIFLLGAIGHDALQGGTQAPPDVFVKTRAASRTGDGYVVIFEAFNRGGGTAAALEIEGRLMDGDRAIETSTATIDYVAGHGSAEGGLFFVNDPANLTIKIRPLGFQTP
ncbi:MAG: hypothetical protein EOO83_01690 [Oxalobacteraceae bacterium]|nr:MAG: hypothetical protein EOO83_01690 [Oxalobacteraceae bacterium]